jgi:hypothetical protein
LWWLNLMYEVELCWDWGSDCLLQEKKCIKKRTNEEGWEESRLSGHKLNTNNDITNIIILLATPSVILLVKIPCHHTINLLFLNLTVIPFVIFSVYTVEIFLSTYLQIYFTIGLTPSVMSFVKVTCHCTIWSFFSFFIFPLQSLNIYWGSFSISIYW